jgi:alpha-N-arabinofuranosidase
MAVPFLLCAFAASGQTGQSSSATIIVDANQVVGHQNPNLYGAFMEMMAWDVKYGLYAEMLHDRSLEEPTDSLGLPRGWNLEPDERNDSAGVIHFERTTDAAYPATNQATGKPEHSLRVTLTAQDTFDTRRGLSQGNLSVRQDTEYVGYLWLKVPDLPGRYRGTITVALEEDVTGGSTYASARIEDIAGDWRKYEFRLHPTSSDRHAKLSILFDGSGSLWMDDASLMPADAVGGVRPEVMTKIQQLRPSFVRWPGGNVAQDYHWEWGIGPRDQRPVWTNVSWSNAIEPSDFGTDEYIEFCRQIGAQPSITVNVEGAGATAEEAAHWVEYVNGPATSKYGSMRAANGHPEPYHVTLWELGNEVYGDWVRGHADAETYAKNAKRYAEAMRAVDPGIQLIAVGESSMPDARQWNSAVLRILGRDINYLAVHDYTSRSDNRNNRTTLMARPLEFEARYKEMHALIQQLLPDHPVPFVVNEWNLFYPSTVIQSMEGAVFASRMMNAFERSGEQVSMTSISDLLDGWVGGIIQASRDGVYVTPQYYTIRMYSSHLGTDRLATVVESPNLSEPESKQTVPALDAVATRSEDGKSVFVKLSNADPALSLRTTIALHGKRANAEAEETLLTGPRPDSRNDFAQPDAVHPVTMTIHCDETCSFQMPPDSVAVVTLRLR